MSGGREISAFHLRAAAVAAQHRGTEANVFPVRQKPDTASAA